MSEEKTPEEKVIQAMEKSAEVYGIRKSYARIYGELYFSDGEKTLDDLNEMTGYARSTISSSMKLLEEFHMVEKEKKEGEGKTHFYTAKEDMEEMFMEFLDNQVRREIDIMTEALDEAEEELDKQGEQEKLDKVRNLKDTYRRSERMIRLIKKLPSGKYMEKINRVLGRNQD